jgi:hypothetical protein
MRETINMLGNTLQATFRLLTHVAKAAKGTSVVVAPFDDQLIRKFGVWVEGEHDEIVAVRDEATKAAEKAGDQVISVPYVARKEK